MWSGTVGLVNGQYKYLTAETFGHKINANGSGLKKKQLWSIEAFPLTASGFGAAPRAGSANVADELDELEHVAIKSHLDCYLAVDQFGNVTCESTELHEGARFTITICSMSPGHGQGGEVIYWAFRNVQRGYYLGATSDGITCTAKMPQSKAELWHVHLIPARGATMFALRSIGRRRYARTVVDASQVNNKPAIINRGDEDSGKMEQIQLDATHPWGSNMLFQFKYYEGGKYALLTSNCKYLSFEGGCISWQPPASPVNQKLVMNRESNGWINGQNGSSSPSYLPPEECLFTIEYHGGSVAFRDSHGKYLAAAGRASILKTRSQNVSRDELFEFEPAPIQVALRAAFNNKWVSIKQGMDLAANQNEVSDDHETFLFDYHYDTNDWTIASKEGKYWSLGAASTIQASEQNEKIAARFAINWNSEDGTCSLAITGDGKTRGSTDPDLQKWICARKSGQLFTAANQDASRFYMRFTNRTSLNLRAANASGFVGLKSGGKIDANKTTPDSIVIEYANSESGDTNDPLLFNCCYFRMPANGKYWSVVDGSNLICDANSPACAQQLLIELRTGSTIAIRAYDAQMYLNLTGTGSLQLASCDPNKVTLWEF